MGIIAQVRSCQRDSLIEARNEVIATVFASTVPVWLGAFLALLISKQGGPGTVLLDFLQGKEGLLLAAALVGPMMYVITKGYGELPRPFTIKFPHALFITLAVALVWTIAAAIFAVSSTVETGTASSSASNLVHINETAMIWVSSITLCVSIALMFAVSALRNDIPRADNAMHEQDEDFLERWKK